MSTDPVPLLPPVETYINPIVAWRAWQYIPSARMLAPLTRAVPVLDRRINKAVCARTMFEDPAGLLIGPGEHQAPHERCTCGFYALRCADAMSCFELNLYVSNFVIGQVYLWGKIVEHLAGFRAEFCYPKMLFARDPDQQSEMTERYQTEKTPCSWAELCAYLIQHRWMSTQLQDKLSELTNFLYPNPNLNPDIPQYTPNMRYMAFQRQPPRPLKVSGSIPNAVFKYPFFITP